MSSFIHFYSNDWLDGKTALCNGSIGNDSEMMMAFYAWYCQQPERFDDISEMFLQATDGIKKPNQAEDDWHAILEEASALGGDVLRKVKQNKDLYDYPPSSVCCGKSRKYRERILKHVRDIISRERELNPQS